MPKVNPEILVWARETAGLTQDEAAKRLGLRDTKRATGVGKLASLERGGSEPTRPQLVRMSQQYRRPLLTFYLSQPPRRADRGGDFRSLPASKTSVDDGLLDALVRDIRARQSMVRAALEEIEEVHPLPFVGSFRISEGQPAITQAVRDLLGIDLSTYRAQSNASAAFGLLREKTESVGIFVLLKGDLGNHATAIDVSIFRGYSIADEIAPFLVINDQDARPAWSFTLLHEIVHLLLGQTGVGNARVDNVIEQFCDGVAGEFLLPSTEVGDLNLAADDTLDVMSHKISEFASDRHISRTMVAYRAHINGAIDSSSFGQLMSLFQHQWRNERDRQRESNNRQDSGPNFYVVRRHRLGNKITGLVRSMMAADALSTSKAARILGVRARQVQPLLADG